MNVLVIVDVQNEFAEHLSEDYLNKLESFLKENKSNYDKIIAIYTDEAYGKEGHLIPSFLKDIPDTFIEKWFYMIDDDFEELEKFTPNEKDVLEDPTGNIILVVEHFDENDHREFDQFLPPHALTTFAGSLSVNDHIDLVGGGLGFCVEDVKSVFDYFRIPTSVLNDVCYSLMLLTSEEIKERRESLECEWVTIPEEKNIRM